MPNQSNLCWQLSAIVWKIKLRHSQKEKSLKMVTYYTSATTNWSFGQHSRFDCALFQKTGLQWNQLCQMSKDGGCFLRTPDQKRPDWCFWLETSDQHTVNCHEKETAKTMCLLRTKTGRLATWPVWGRETAKSRKQDFGPKGQGTSLPISHALCGDEGWRISAGGTFHGGGTSLGVEYPWRCLTLVLNWLMAGWGGWHP